MTDLEEQLAFFNTPLGQYAVQSVFEEKRAQAEETIAAFEAARRIDWKLLWKPMTI